ncbi:MAG: LemA family protein [bacterium]|nr:LemA family protein [bacterium]MDZ4247984.1 LemA family protein [Patescibacteria group bacterium]
MNLTTILLIVLGVIVVAVIAIYNSLVRLKNRTDEAWSDIDVQTKRRYDLIPNLIDTVKGYAKHESELFQKVTKARTDAIKAEGPAKQAAAENVLTDALKSVFAVAENYPQLRATENFQKLQDELADTENKIMAARRFYNANVRDLNTKIETFPTNLIAGMLGFKQREFFELDESETAAAREPVKAKF